MTQRHNTLKGKVAMNKRCYECLTIKPFSEFNKSRSINDGHERLCRICKSKKRLEYTRTKDGLVSKIYKKQIQSSKRRGMHSPKYSKQELKEWMFRQDNFEILFNNWVKSGYQKEIIPSVDRLDNYIGYTISNIQLVTWKENQLNAYRDARQSPIGRQQKFRPVLQLSIDGEIVNEYHSIAEAARVNKIRDTGICDCCNGRYHTSGGYVWAYRDSK